MPVPPAIMNKDFTVLIVGGYELNLRQAIPEVADSDASITLVVEPSKGMSDCDRLSNLSCL